MHPEMSSSVSGLNTPGTTAPLFQLGQPKMSPDMAQCSLGGKIAPGGEPSLWDFIGVLDSRQETSVFKDLEDSVTQNIQQHMWSLTGPTSGIAKRWWKPVKCMYAS